MGACCCALVLHMLTGQLLYAFMLSIMLAPLHSLPGKRVEGGKRVERGGRKKRGGATRVRGKETGEGVPTSLVRVLESLSEQV